MMADKQGLLGARSDEDSDEVRQSTDAFGAARDEREAYEEDWYRSLRALAERQAQLAEHEDTEDASELLAGGEPNVDEPDRPVEAQSEPDEVESQELQPSPVEWHEAVAEPPRAPEGEPHETGSPDEGYGSEHDMPQAPADEAGPPSWDTLVAEHLEQQEDAGPEPEPFVQDAEPEHGPEPHLRIVPSPDDGDREGAVVEGEGPEAAYPVEEPIAPEWEEPALGDRGNEPQPEAPAADEDVVPGTDDGAALLDTSFGDLEPLEARPDLGHPEEAVSEPVVEPLLAPEPEAVEPEPPAPTLTSTDPFVRRLALEELASHKLSDADTRRIEALLLDPETEIRRLALETLGRRPDRVDAEAVRQALQDPTDEVRAVAVGLAAKRGEVAHIAPFLAARDWPLTNREVRRLLPEVVAASPVDDDAMRRVLDAIGSLDPAPQPAERPSLAQLALALGSRRILDALSWPDVPRLGAIRLLSYDRSPVVLRELAAHSGDPLEEIREIAANAIEEIVRDEAARERIPSADGAPSPDDGTDRIASLARALLDDDATVRHLALSGLAGMDRGAIAAWVREAIGSGDPSRLSLAASTAQQLRLVEGAADVLDAAAGLPVDARHGLVEALTSFVMPPDQLAALLSQVREPRQPEAIRMLWQIGGPQMLSHLRPYLDDPSAPVRLAVLDVFAESGDPSAVDVARIALETDVSPIVRARAVRVLAQLTATPPVSTVVRALSDPDPDVRATAIETLPDVDGPEAIDALTSSLSDPDDRVRLAAAKRLAARAADPELVWSSLRRAPEAGRDDIIASFERVRSGSLTQIALERLRSPDQEERSLAVEVCGWGASPGCVEGAIHALLDPSALVRRSATVALGHLRDPAAAKALGKALGDPDPEVRVGVVRALGVIDDETVLGFLVSALNDPDPRVRDVTSQVLTEWSSPAVARRLAGVLAVPRLREAATDLLTRIGPPAVELLIDVLMQNNPAVVPTVGELLRRIAKPDEFLARLDAVEPERRLRGVHALGAIGGPEAVNALLRSVADPDERIRARAAQLLGELGDQRARDALVGLLRDPIPGVVAAAQDALSRLGD
jgi:HEAT repeat protein